jgi:hypothetical protein
MIMKINLARFLIGFVFLFNVQCALVFLIWPEKYVGSFELSGAPGEAMLRGLGVLFLMWNVPYAVAIWNPVRYRLALWIAIAMQAIGLVGEIWIALLLPVELVEIRSTISRFVVFDATGLLLLSVAAWLVVKDEQLPGER